MPTNQINLVDQGDSVTYYQKTFTINVEKYLLLGMYPKDDILE